LIATTDGLTREATSAILGSDWVEPLDKVICVCAPAVTTVVPDVVDVEDMDVFFAVVRY
jgi:hypothetical protein